MEGPGLLVCYIEKMKNLYFLFKKEKEVKTVKNLMLTGSVVKPCARNTCSAVLTRSFFCDILYRTVSEINTTCLSVQYGLIKRVSANFFFFLVLLICYFNKSYEIKINGPNF